MLCARNRNLRIDIVFPRANSISDVLFFLYLLHATYDALTSSGRDNITFDMTYQRRMHETSNAKRDTTRNLTLTRMMKLPLSTWRDHLVALCECVGKLSAREQRWLGYRALRKATDFWAEMAVEDTLAMKDAHGRDVWTWDEEVEGTLLDGECQDREHLVAKQSEGF